MKSSSLFQVAKFPHSSLVYSNSIYCSPTDHARFVGYAVNGKVYAEVQGFVWWLEPHSSMAVQTISFNSFQRLCGSIQEGDQVSVTVLDERSLGRLLAVAKVAVDVYPPNKASPVLEVEGDKVQQLIQESLENHVLTQGQFFPMSLDIKSDLRVIVKVTVNSLSGIAIDSLKSSAAPSVNTERRGIISAQTQIEVVGGESGTIRVQSNSNHTRSIFRPDFNFEDLGIGGLSKEFGDIFRRAFASRVFPPKMIRELGTNYVRGMLLYGPPGTGKTLIARQIAKFLKAREPKIVNGPEILDMYVGQSEKKIRELFEDAEKEYKKEGENSQLHIIILDEIDAICKSRGGAGSSGGRVNDSIVNQLLSKIDGVDSLNNILLIGMTNRLDMIDEALLRPGRLEVHVEISLADEKGRVEIFNIHTKKMRDNGYLSGDVSIADLAKRSKNFSGAEIEGLVRAAQSHALNRHVNLQNVAAGVTSKDLEKIKITNADFDAAFDDIKPAFGQHEEDLENMVRHGIIQFNHKMGDVKHRVDKVLSRLVQAAATVSSNNNTTVNTNLIVSVSDVSSLLIMGIDGSGKSALACDTARRFGFPFVRVVTADSFVGMSEHDKVSTVVRVFDDAYKTKMSCIILDDLERLCEFVSVGPRFSNSLLQAILIYIKKPHPKMGSKLQIIATCHESFVPFLEEVGGLQCFTESVAMPLVENAREIEILLSHAGSSARMSHGDPRIAEVCVSMISPLPVKQVLMLAEGAKQADMEIDRVIQ